MLVQLYYLMQFTILGVILILLFAKISLFMKQRHGHDYQIMCLLYFPGIDIMFTSDSREKRDKKTQNRLTRIIMILMLCMLLLLNFHQVLTR